MLLPMEGYKRTMVFQDTGLKWVPTSPYSGSGFPVWIYGNRPGEGTGVHQADQFKWIGGKGSIPKSMPTFSTVPAWKALSLYRRKNPSGRSEASDLDYHTFNPARTGIYALAYAFSLGDFHVPKGGQTPQDMVMFDKVMGSNKIGLYLEEGLTPQQIEANYTPALNRFKEERKKYLIEDYEPLPGDITVLVDGRPIDFDSPPFIDSSNRIIVPVRFVTEALGGMVGWEPASRTVTILRENDTVLFRINSPSAVVNEGGQSDGYRSCVKITAR